MLTWSQALVPSRRVRTHWQTFLQSAQATREATKAAIHAVRIDTTAASTTAAIATATHAVVAFTASGAEKRRSSTGGARVAGKPVKVIKSSAPVKSTDAWHQKQLINYWKETVDMLEENNATGKKECELPNEMECGCKTRRLKEQKEAETLRARQQDGQGAAKPAVSFESTWYRRLLPQECIAFSSPEGRKLFTEAINYQDNHMQIYFPLAEQFITQAEPAFCGLATLAMCLNALQIDPGRLWKGPWRWYSEELFDCCTSLSVAKEKGISLSEFICLARCNGVITEDLRANSSFTLDQFRSIVKRCCATSSEIVVLNYSRKVLGQTGDGHFSPIGGYHAERDMVLLLDVARFKYPPHWVKLSLVFEAMQQVDESIGLPRGLVILKENAHATGPTLVHHDMMHAAASNQTESSLTQIPPTSLAASASVAAQSCGFSTTAARHSGAFSIHH